VQRTDTSTYTLRLAPEKLRNTGYVCNVLRAVGAPLTNQYALNPDLYYLGIYGTPVKLLPDAIIERNIYRDGEGDLHSVYSRVGSDYYFYEDNAMLTLEEVKAHLRYDSDDNDAALQIMLDAAQQAIKTHCDPNQNLDTAAIKQAALLLIGYWDNNRNAEQGNEWYLPQPVLALLAPYRTPVAV